MLNYHLDWFSTFWYIWIFLFHHSGWKLSFQGQICRILSCKRGQISVFHFITPKRHILTWFCVFWAIMRQNSSTGLFSTLVWEKNKEINKSHKKLYFTRLPRSPPRMDFYQIWNKRSSRRRNDLDKLCVNLFKGFNFTGRQNLHLPIGNWRRRYDSSALPCSLWYLAHRQFLQCLDTAGWMTGSASGPQNSHSSNAGPSLIWSDLWKNSPVKQKPKVETVVIAIVTQRQMKSIR